MEMHFLELTLNKRPKSLLFYLILSLFYFDLKIKGPIEYQRRKTYTQTHYSEI